MAALEAQEVAVRVRLLDGARFKAEAAEAGAAVRGLGTTVAETNSMIDTSAMKGGGLVNFLGGSSKALDTVSGKLDRFSKGALQVGRQTAAMSAGAGFLVYESVKEAASYEGKMTLLMTQAHATLKMREELERKGKGMSKLGIDPTEYADALYPIQSVFHNVTKDYEAVKASAEGAAVGHDTLANATNAMVAGFKTGFKDVHGFKEEMALLDETVGAGKMHLPELTAIFHGSLMPTGAALGMSQRSLLATIASVSQEGQEPEEYSTRLRTALLKTVNLKGEALHAATRMGFSKTQMQEDLRAPDGMLKLLRELAGASKRLGPNEGPADIAAVFGGSRSAGTILTALHNLKANEEITARLVGVKGSGTLDQHFNPETTRTMTFQIKALKGEAHEALLEMGKFFGPPVIGGLKDLAGVLQGVAEGFGKLPTPIKDASGVLLIFAVAAAPVAFLLGGLAGGLKLLLWPMKAVLTEIVAMNSAEGFSAIESGLYRLQFAMAGSLGPVLGLAAAVGLLMALTLEGGKHPFNAYEEAYHQLMGGYTAKEKEAKAAEKKETENFLLRRHKEDARQHAAFAQSHRHPWSNHIHNAELKRSAEALERAEPDRVARGLPPIEIKLYHKTDLNGRQLALELVRPLKQVERAENHRR